MLCPHCAIVVGNTAKTKDLDFTASAAAGAGAVVPTATYILFREMFQKPRDWRSIRDGIAAKELKKVAPGAATESYSFTHTLRALKVPAKYYAVTLLASAAIAGTGASVSQRMAVGADARPKPKPKAKPAAESKAVAPAAPAHAPAAVAPAAAATHDSASEAHHEPAHSASPAPAGDSHAKH